MRKLTTGTVGGPILGQLVSLDTTLQSKITNGNINLDPNGTGIVTSDANIQINSANGLVLADSDNSNTITVKSPGTVASDLTYTLPGSVTDGYFLQTDSSGNLVWAAAAVNITNQNTDTSTYYPIITQTTSGALTTVNSSSSKLSFQPSSGTLTSTTFSGTSSTLTGTLTAASIVETSSIELKENINPIHNALDKLVQLKGVTYDRKDKTAFNEAGFLAEDVEKVLPNLVVKDKDGNPYGINYTKFSAYLIEAVKTLKQEIKELKGEK